MPNVEVNCTVSNCVFHEKSNICGAKEILVEMNYSPKKDTEEFASDFYLRPNTEQAAHSVDTCCKTFKPKFKSSKNPWL